MPATASTPSGGRRRRTSGGGGGGGGVRLEPMNASNAATTNTTAAALVTPAPAEVGVTTKPKPLNTSSSKTSRKSLSKGTSALPELSPRENQAEADPGKKAGAALLPLSSGMRTPSSQRRRTPLDPIAFAQEVMPSPDAVEERMRKSSDEDSRPHHGTGGGGAGGQFGMHPPFKPSLVPLVSPSADPVSSRRIFKQSTKVSFGEDQDRARVGKVVYYDDEKGGEEKRKTTPPDLLELSNMYFDKQQKMMTPNFRLSESTHSFRISRYSNLYIL